jgi:hypothetical protein
MVLAGRVNVSLLRELRTCHLNQETKGGSVGSCPFTGEHTALRPRHISTPTEWEKL